MKHFLRSFHIGFANGKQFKAAVKRLVRLYKFPVFIIRSCADHGDLTSCQLRLKKVRCTTTYAAILMIQQGMDLVDEKNCIWKLFYLADNIFQPVFDFTFVRGTCDQGSKIKLKEKCITELSRHFPVDNIERETIDQGSLANTGIANYDHVRLGAPAEYFHHHPRFFVTPDDWICFSLPCQCCAFNTIFI